MTVYIVTYITQHMLRISDVFPTTPSPSVLYELVIYNEISQCFLYDFWRIKDEITLVKWWKKSN